MLCQTLHLRKAKGTQIFSILMAQMTCNMMLRNLMPFVGLNIISYSPTNYLLIRQLLASAEKQQSVLI